MKTVCGSPPLRSQSSTYLPSDGFIAGAAEALGLGGNAAAAEVGLQQPQHGVQAALARRPWRGRGPLAHGAWRGCLGGPGGWELQQGGCGLSQPGDRRGKVSDGLGSRKPHWPTRLLTHMVLDSEVRERGHQSVQLQGGRGGRRFGEAGGGAGRAVM